MTKWQAIIFDLDDTLYPERSFVFSGFKAVSRWGEKNLEIPAEHGYTELQGLYEEGVRGDTFNRWLESHGSNHDEVVFELIEIYRNHQPDIKPFLSVPKLLTELQVIYLLGLITDGFLYVQQSKLAALGLEKYFQEIIFTDTWGRKYWKPHKKAFHTIVDQLQVLPARTVYVGDNPKKDFLGAKEVGLKTIQVRREGGEYADLQPPTPDHAPHAEICSLRQLVDTLSELEKI